MAQPNLPSRFPCWCRATYSWGGETKRDLGFIEGDLIECLNAGDGLWWMGRLHRDRRAMGLFPSNFVKVLDESFRPVSRSVSPLPPRTDGNGSASPLKSSGSPQKSKTFRKPFQAYVKTNGSHDSRNTSPSAKAPQSKSSFRKPFQAYSQASSPQTTPPPNPTTMHHSQPSPSPSRQSSYLQAQGPQRGFTRDRIPRQSSHLSYINQSSRPSSRQEYRDHSRTVSPMLAQSNRSSSGCCHHDTEADNDPESSSPPPPPPHRVTYHAWDNPRGQSPDAPTNDACSPISGAHTPLDTSRAVLNSTPSPLRDAIEDVMSSLQHMSTRPTAPSLQPEKQRSPSSPWCPEAFEDFRTGHSADRQAHGPEAEMQIEQSAYPFNSFETHSSPDGEPRGVPPSDELFLPDDRRHPLSDSTSRYTSGVEHRPSSSHSVGMPPPSRMESFRKLRNRKSAYELGREKLGRTFTMKSSATNSSCGILSTTTNGTSSTQRTSQSVMSGHSAGGFSATSAGSLARKRALGSIRRDRPQSVLDGRVSEADGTFARPKTPSTALSSRSDPHTRSRSAIDPRYLESTPGSAGMLGGLTTPKQKKSGFFKKLVESAKTGAASARGSIASGQAQPPRSPIKNLLPSGVTAISGGRGTKESGMVAGQSEMDWVQVRRDVNRSNSLSQNERAERVERCQMMDYPVIAAVDSLLHHTDGDEGHDGLPIQHPTDFRSVNLQLVDKTTRFVNNMPTSINAVGLVQGYLCRPYKSDIQKLRAIFIWTSERVAWEDDFEGDIDTRRVLQTRRGCSKEIATLVMEMCRAAGIHSEVAQGYLKTPGEVLDFDCNKAPNHWWNTVIAEGEWRIMDCSLANPTNPRREWYSQAGSQVAESGYFLTRPSEICYTHVPSLVEQQHICPPVAPEILLALPCASPSFFRNQLRMVNFDTSLSRIDNLELVQIQFTVPPDIECVAETEVREYCRDLDGDVFESGDLVKTRALAQAEWVDGEKRYTVKGHLPGDEGHGTLKVYSGKRGLMHSIKDNPHPLSFSIPVIHSGSNPSYQYFLRHPTPHAQRHDLYVVQPQCARLAINNTFVFAIRQHPSHLPCLSPTEAQTPGSFAPNRPSSAMSMISTSAVSTTTDYLSQTGSVASGSSSQQSQQKPAKLAIQSPSGKVIRLMRKSDNSVSANEAANGGVWETIIKVGERGNWRGLVLADRSARWCVFGEWECF